MWKLEVARIEPNTFQLRADRADQHNQSFSIKNTMGCTFHEKKDGLAFLDKLKFQRNVGTN